MNFNPDTDIQSLTDKVIFLTGGTDGLGKETLRQLSRHSCAHIYLAARSKAKAESVLRELEDSYANHAPITVLHMDLSNLSSVKTAATEFLSTNHRLDILICNAGAMGPPALTKDGYEMAFGTNHLAHALLIQLLLPTLRKTAEQPGSDVRVVTLSSSAEGLAPKNYTFDKMETNLSDQYKMVRYGQSKLANIHYTKILAQEYPDILFVSVNPGNVRTNIVHSFWGDTNPIVKFIVSGILQIIMSVVEVEEGAKGQLWCATGKRDSLQNGEFYWPIAKTGKGSSKTKDMKMAQALYDWTDAELRGFL